MKYSINHIPVSNDKRPKKKITPSYITVHSTGNPASSAINERNWLTNPQNDRTASFHIVIDETQAIEVIPLNELAYHAGTPEGNSKSIGIEICESGDRLKTLSEAQKLIAGMLKERGWGIAQVKRHFDWSGKICPRIMYDKNSNNQWGQWLAFLQGISNLL